MLGQRVQCPFYLPPVHLSVKQRGTSCYRRAASSLPASNEALPGCREKQILPKSNQKSHASAASWRHTHLWKRGASPAALPGPRHHFSTWCNLGMCLLPLLPRAFAHYVTHLLCFRPSTEELFYFCFISSSIQALKPYENTSHPSVSSVQLSLSPGIWSPCLLWPTSSLRSRADKQLFSPAT